MRNVGPAMLMKRVCWSGQRRQSHRTTSGSFGK